MDLTEAEGIKKRCQRKKKKEQVSRIDRRTIQKKIFVIQITMMV